jgi:hypothetical protein
MSTIDNSNHTATATFPTYPIIHPTPIPHPTPLHIGGLILFHPSEQRLAQPRDYPPVFLSVSAHHGEGLASACLAVGKGACVVPVYGTAIVGGEVLEGTRD